MEPSPPIGVFYHNPLPATVDWTGQDGQTCSLGNPATPVSFIVDYEPSSQATLFLLRVDVELRRAHKAADMKTSLFMHLVPGEVRSLTLNDPVQTSEGSDDRHRLQFQLSSPMGLVGPENRLRPKNKTQTAVLDTIILLAQQTAFTVDVQCEAALKGQLQWLCDATSKHWLRSADTSAKRRDHYRGRGGCVIDTSQFRGHPDTWTQSPPAYGDLGTGLEANPSQKKRRLDSPTERTDLDSLAGLSKLLEGGVVDMVASKVADKVAERVADGMADKVADRLADRMEGKVSDSLADKVADRLADRIVDQVADMLADRMADKVVDRMDDRVADRIATRLDGQDKQKQDLQAEVEELQEEVEEIRGEVQGVRDCLGQEIEAEVDDQMLSVKEDLREYVEEQVENAADIIREQLAAGDIVVEGTVRLVGGT